MHFGVHVKPENEKYDRRDNQTVIDEGLFPVGKAMAGKPGNDDKQQRHKSYGQQTSDNYY